MDKFTSPDIDAADERVAHMLQVLAPHHEELGRLMDAYHSIFLHMPFVDHFEAETKKDAVQDPATFKTGILMSFCFTLAHAEQHTHTAYADDAIYTKIVKDINDDMMEMTSIERGGQNRAN